MKTHKTVVIIWMLFFLCNINAQKFELGKVLISELEEKQHPHDSSAVAAILFKIGETGTRNENGMVTTTEVKMRIKIYTKEGLDWANQKVLYVSQNNIENVSFYDAVTYNLVEGKIVKTKLKSDGQFDEKINKYVSQKKIALPNVREGSVIEFRYVIKSYGFGNPKEWAFQTTIPMNHCEYKTYIPQFLIFKKSQKGFVFPKIKEEKINNSAGFYDNVTTYTAENFPAIKKEPFVNNIDNYTSSISHELSVIDIRGRPLMNIATDWETIAKKIYKLDDFGLELNKTGYFEKGIDSLITGLEKRDAKIAAIFNYVKKNVKWNKYYGYTCDDGVKKAFKSKGGNVAEINLMLTAMLRYAGLSANPVLLSTRSNGIALFPSRTAFNYVIAAVEIQDDVILLDATEQFAEPNVLPLRDLNWYGRLIRKEGSSAEVDLFPKSTSKSVINMNLRINASGTAEGKLRNQLSNHNALEFREENKDTSQDTYIEDLESRYNSIEIGEYARENNSDVSQPLIETFTFKDNKSIEAIDNKMYFSPLLFLRMKDNPFKQEIREYPIDFGFPFQKKYNISIEIPEGYTLETLPETSNLVTEENAAAFKYVIGAREDKIQVTVTFDILKPIIASDFYDVLKDFYQKVADKENEKIILIKK